MPPEPTGKSSEEAEKKDEPKRFVVIRYGSDALLETNLNRLYNEGYELRSVSYDPGLKRGAWGAVLENPSIPRRRSR